MCISPEGHKSSHTLKITAEVARNQSATTLFFSHHRSTAVDQMVEAWSLTIGGFSKSFGEAKKSATLPIVAATALL